MSGNKSKDKQMQEATFSAQLDFNWLPSLREPKIQDSAEGATESSTTGPQLCEPVEKQDRLFVPLASEPFDWFIRGEKKWELRKFGRQYTPKHVRVGRQVELRRGYRNKDILRGTIVEVIEAHSLEELFARVPFREVIPTASSVSDAVAVAGRILNSGSAAHFLAFSVGKLR
jgi:hypothetical protein